MGGEESSSGVGETLLLVDAEEMFRIAIGAALGRRGYSVLLAGAAHAAMDLFHQHAAQIDAVILELALPGIPAIEVLHRMRRIRGDVKVVLTGAPDRFGSGKTAVDGKGAVFLRKPYRVNELVGQLRLLRR